MISGDKRMLEEGSEANARLALQRAEVEELDVYVWPHVHSWREVAMAAEREHYDVVTAQDPFWRGLLAWRVACNTGAVLNLQVHTDLSAQPSMRQALARFLLRRADTVRVVSRAIAEQLKPLMLRARVSILPVYIEVSRFAAITRTPHAGTKDILWVGRFEEEKNPLLALTVLEELRNEHSDATLVMLGAGSLEERLRSRAQEQKLPVEFPGWQDPLPYLAQADAVLSTSRHESYGASIIEALAAGVPVVALDVGVAREAGALIAAPNELAPVLARALQSNARGELKLSLPGKEAWAQLWRATLA